MLPVINLVSSFPVAIGLSKKFSFKRPAATKSRMNNWDFELRRISNKNYWTDNSYNINFAFKDGNVNAFVVGKSA